MSILCHISNFMYPKDKFINTNDPNTVYTIGRDSCITPLNLKYSSHFQQKNNECSSSNNLKDPCKDILEKPHFQIPDDVKKECSSLIPQEDNDEQSFKLSDEDYKKLLKIHAMNQSRKLPTYPWFS